MPRLPLLLLALVVVTAGCMSRPLARTTLTPLAAMERYYLDINSITAKVYYVGSTRDAHHFYRDFDMPLGLGSREYFAVARGALSIFLERPVGRATPCDIWLPDALAKAVRADGQASERLEGWESARQAPPPPPQLLGKSLPLADRAMAPREALRRYYPQNGASPGRLYYLGSTEQLHHFLCEPVPGSQDLVYFALQREALRIFLERPAGPLPSSCDLWLKEALVEAVTREEQAAANPLRGDEVQRGP